MDQATRKILLRLSALVVVMGLAAALTFGYLGRLHPAFDSFSHLRLHLAALMALCVPVLVLMRLRLEAVFALTLAVAATVQTMALPLLAEPTAEAEAGGAVYRLLHINLRYDNATPEAALSLIGRIRPDVVTLNEVSQQWVDRLALIEAAYPYRIVCPPPSPVGGVAILSRRPFAPHFEPYCGDRGAFAHARVDFGGRTMDVATLHLGWPWPFAQPWQLPHLAPLLASVGETAIVAGDLNSVPWSHSARQVAAAADARLLRGIGPTWLHGALPAWLRPLIGFPIDNVMVKGEVVPLGVGTTDSARSDHLPVLLEFTLPPQEAEPGVLQAVNGEW